MNGVPTERFVADIKILMGDVEDLLKATAAQSGEKIAEVRTRAQEALANTRETLARAESMIVDQTKAAAKVVDRSVHDHPWRAVGVSAVAGVLVGLLIGRR
jgi:ElaB/YqjD/DUF883 family membrane-anchored ribosome-binding protein